MSLGKRKRHAEADNEQSSSSGSEDDATMRALFQRAFEAKFKPLPQEKAPVVDLKPELHDNANTDDGDSDWSGFTAENSDGDVDEDVEVFQHSNVSDYDREQHKRELKAYMSAKPPTLEDKPQSTGKQKPDTGDDDEGERANLKHDLALQRLLKESHLLDPSTFKGTVAAPEGKGRLKALDLRLQGLGAKKSSLDQEKTPLSHRKGIVAKSTQQDQQRRKAAAENGVILERAKAAAKAQIKRDRGVTGPGVGKFQGSTLKLSSKDVRHIEGSKQSSVSGKKHRKR